LFINSFKSNGGEEKISLSLAPQGGKKFRGKSFLEMAAFVVKVPYLRGDTLDCPS